MKSVRHATLLTALVANAALLGATTLAPASAEAAEPRGDWLDIEVGKSVVIETPKNATAIAITDPTVADIVPLASANKIQVQGKSVGTTDLIIQLGPGVEPTRFEITVHTDLSDLVRRVGEIVEGEPPRVYPLAKHIVVEGSVPDLDTLEQVAQVARAYDPEFVNLLEVRGDHQVQLEVVFAEVSRSATRALGFNWSFEDQAADPIVDAAIVQPGTPPGAFSLAADFPGIGLTTEIRVLDENKLSKYLAQPTLTCMSGQQCEFLAGGETPTILPSGGGGQAQITYREYGLKVSFVPTVLAGNVIDLRVSMELSEIDPGGGLTIQGGSAPGLLSRKSKGHVRVGNGNTMVLSGLLLEHTAYQRAEIPLLGRIPVVGTLFRYVEHKKDEREMIVFVTPRLVRPLGPGEVPAAPGTTEDNNPTDLELFLLGLDHRPGSRTAEPTGDVGLQR